MAKPSRHSKANLFAKMSFLKRRQLERMYLNGEKMEVIAATFGKHVQDVQKYLRNVGVPRRANGRPKSKE